MRRWIIVTLIFALVYVSCETAEQKMANRAAELRSNTMEPDETMSHDTGGEDMEFKSILSVADNGRSYYGNRSYSKSSNMRLNLSARSTGLRVGEGVVEMGHKPSVLASLDASDPVIRMGHSKLSRTEQIKLMTECVEDAIPVCQDANIYPLSTWYRDGESEDLSILAPEIAVAFFNYRIGD